MNCVVRVEALGAAARAAGLLAEYDAEHDAIRVSAGAAERVRAALGEREARRFVTCAVEHERYHRAHPEATEADAHAAAERACGVDPRRYEAVLREPRA